MFSLIILSGGKGKRMEKVIPKQYLLLAGKPMIMHTIERADKIEDIKEIIIVCETEYKQSLEIMMKQYNIRTEVKFAKAGATRQESVYNGLKMVKSESVIVHEAARPFVYEEDFKKLIADENPNVMYGYPIPFTVVEGAEKVEGILDRSRLINVQLPQKFETALLKKAHEKALVEGLSFTEDASLVFECEKAEVKVIKGNSYNIKITEPIDLLVGEIIYKEFTAGRK